MASSLAKSESTPVVNTPDQKGPAPKLVDDQEYPDYFENDPKAGARFDKKTKAIKKALGIR